MIFASTVGMAGRLFPARCQAKSPRLGQLAAEAGDHIARARTGDAHNCDGGGREEEGGEDGVGAHTGALARLQLRVKRKFGRVGRNWTMSPKRRFQWHAS